MATLERAILAGAKLVFCNSKLRMKDVREWRTSAIESRDGEVVAYVSDLGVYVAVEIKHDRRTGRAGGGE